MIGIYRKIKNHENTKNFSMPTSIKIIKELATHNLGYNDIKHMHWIDLMSLIYSFRIDDAKQYLKSKGKENLQKNGIDSVQDIQGSDILKYMGG